MDTRGDITERLRADWLDLTGPFGVDRGAAEEAFADLAGRYAEPARAYHNLRHLDEVLATVDRLRDHARNLAAVRFAAWFHDAIYDTRARDNEQRSADLAAAVLGQLRVAGEVVAAAQELILLTRTHQARPDDRDGHVLVDADLAILGAAPDRYAEYRSAIRQEYAWVPEEPYRSGRKQVLQGFVRRERIYYVDVMYAALEAQARRNVADEIAALS